MPYRQNFPIPDVIDPPKMCLCLQIPDDPTWKSVLQGLLYELQYWFNWERDESNSGKQCAAVWKEVYNGIDWSNMSCCCQGVTPVQFQYNEFLILQISVDGGVTWTDAPEFDPRNNSTRFPDVPVEGADQCCVHADSAVLLIKEQVGDQLTDDMTRYTLAQLINDWVQTLIATSNPFLALMTVISNQIFALVIATLRPALTNDVYEQLRCIIVCHMADDFSFDETRWTAARAQILADVAGIAGIFLEHLIFLIGQVGLTNLVRAGAGSPDADCSGCFCPSDFVDVFVTETAGEFVSRVDEILTARAIAGGPSNYVLALQFGSVTYPQNVDTCGLMNFTVTDGVVDAALATVSLCGTADQTGIAYNDVDTTCVNQLVFVSTVIFTVDVFGTPCP
jgi:hypothetical protein